MSRNDDLQRFYEIIARLEAGCGEKRRLSSCDGRTGWPTRGVYFFFEGGETRQDGVTPRVVRVGTHALRPSATTLWQRLSQHKGNTGGAHPAGGNHRGSIFRLHVGAALLATDAWSEEIAASWGKNNTASKEIREIEYPLERAVSQHIGSMPFLWLRVDDPPGPASNRGLIEANAISLLSNVDRSSCDPPSPSWLGRRAARLSIRNSGLWNVNHVAAHHNAAFLDILATYVDRAGPDHAAHN